MKGAYITIRVEDDLVGRIDALRDDRSRSQWCRKALERVVADNEKSKAGLPPIVPAPRSPAVASGPKAKRDDVEPRFEGKL